MSLVAFLAGEADAPEEDVFATTWRAPPPDPIADSLTASLTALDARSTYILDAAVTATTATLPLTTVAPAPSTAPALDALVGSRELLGGLSTARAALAEQLTAAAAAASAADAMALSIAQLPRLDRVIAAFREYTPPHVQSRVEGSIARFQARSRALRARARVQGIVAARAAAAAAEKCDAAELERRAHEARVAAFARRCDLALASRAAADLKGVMGWGALAPSPSEAPITALVPFSTAATPEGTSAILHHASAFPSTHLPIGAVSATDVGASAASARAAVRHITPSIDRVLGHRRSGSKGGEERSGGGGGIPLTKTSTIATLLSSLRKKAASTADSGVASAFVATMPAVGRIGEGGATASPAPTSQDPFLAHEQLQLLQRTSRVTGTVLTRTLASPALDDSAALTLSCMRAAEKAAAEEEKAPADAAVLSSAVAAAAAAAATTVVTAATMPTAELRALERVLRGGGAPGIDVVLGLTAGGGGVGGAAAAPPSASAPHGLTAAGISGWRSRARGGGFASGYPTSAAATDCSSVASTEDNIRAAAVPRLAFPSAAAVAAYGEGGEGAQAGAGGGSHGFWRAPLEEALATFPAVASSVQGLPRLQRRAGEASDSPHDMHVVGAGEEHDGVPSRRAVAALVASVRGDRATWFDADEAEGGEGIVTGGSGGRGSNVRDLLSSLHSAAEVEGVGDVDDTVPPDALLPLERLQPRAYLPFARNEPLLLASSAGEVLATMPSTRAAARGARQALALERRVAEEASVAERQRRLEANGGEEEGDGGGEAVDGGEQQVVAVQEGGVEGVAASGMASMSIPLLGGGPPFASSLAPAAAAPDTSLLITLVRHHSTTMLSTAGGAGPPSASPVSSVVSGSTALPLRDTLRTGRGGWANVPPPPLSTMHAVSFAPPALKGGSVTSGSVDEGGDGDGGGKVPPLSPSPSPSPSSASNASYFRAHLLSSTLVPRAQLPAPSVIAASPPAPPAPLTPLAAAIASRVLEATRGAAGAATSPSSPVALSSLLPGADDSTAPLKGGASPPTTTTMMMTTMMVSSTATPEESPMTRWRRRAGMAAQQAPLSPAAAQYLSRLGMRTTPLPPDAEGMSPPHDVGASWPEDAEVGDSASVLGGGGAEEGGSVHGGGGGGVYHPHQLTLRGLLQRSSSVSVRGADEHAAATPALVGAAAAAAAAAAAVRTRVLADELLDSSLRRLRGMGAAARAAAEARVSVA